MDIQPQLLNLDKFLNNRLFRIPQYQRAYSWRTNERQDLFDDIVKLAQNQDEEATHFMATVVGLRRGRKTILTTSHDIIEIVDGQQRITSLILLLKAITLSLSPSDDKEAAVKRELESLLVKEDEVSLLLLQTNHDLSHYFAHYLRAGEHPSSSVATTVADYELLRAMEESESFVGSWDQGLLSLVSLVKNRLVFILHEIVDEALVYTVFEVLNSRGLAVSWFDRMKTVLMSMAFESPSGNRQELVNELHAIWSDIYATVGLRQGLSTEALRFAASLRARYQPSRPLSEEDAVAELRSRAASSAPGVIDVSKWLLAVTAAVDELHRNQRLNAVTRIVQARLLAVAILLRADLSKREKELALRAWERVTFRIYGLSRRDARTKVGDYVRLAWAATRPSMTLEHILLAIRRLGADFPATTAAEALRDNDRYSEWQADLRYFFFRYEESLAKRDGLNFSNEQWNRIWTASAAESIEHIFPQGETSLGMQAGDFGLNPHRLGNLVLLPPRLNSKLQNKLPSEKADSYVETGLLVARGVAKRIKHNNGLWTLPVVRQREEELIAWAATEWGDDEPGHVG